MLSLNELFPSPEVVAFVTDRSTNFRSDDKPYELTKEQKVLLSKAAGRSVERLLLPVQVHGSRVVELTNASFQEERRSEADAVITAQRGLPIAIRTADCLSAFIFDPQTKGIGLVHAGWRGTRQELLPYTLQMMEDRFGTDLKEVIVVFGPAIRSCCYEVGEEFNDYFPAYTVHRGGRWYLDLVSANLFQLKKLGVNLSQVHDCRICNCCRTEFFSYRREGENAGRMLSFMMVKGE